MSTQRTNEHQCLAWIEGELDQEASRKFEQELQRDPELALQVQAMRRDRDLLQSMPVPPVPADLPGRVEQTLANTMLTDDAHPAPGRFRRRKQRVVPRLNWPARLRVAAMIVVGVGAITAIAYLTPVNRILSGLHDENMVASDAAGGSIFVLDTPRAEPGSVDETVQVAGVKDSPVTPEPLAMVLDATADLLPSLRSLVQDVGGTLVRNASPKDLMNEDYTATLTGSGRSAARQEPERSVLSGDSSLAPSYDDQFGYAAAGAVYTVAVPLSRLDDLLMKLELAYGADGAVLLLQDHLASSGEIGLMQTLRAREAVSSWTRGDEDPIVILPVFQP